MEQQIMEKFCVSPHTCRHDKDIVPAAYNQFSSSIEEITVQCLLSSGVAVLHTSGRHSTPPMVQELKNNALSQNAT